jgi:vacuolar-type H+-ATPase subunit F/Vma7
MKPLFLTDSEDALGFGMAGLETHACTSRADVEAEIARADKDVVFVFSRRTASLIRDRLDAWRKDPAGPMFVVLPHRA